MRVLPHNAAPVRNGRLAAGFWPLAILAYFTVQGLLRVLVGPALFWDEAEAFFHARRLAWGYGAQPPLYFWLQWGVFQILGENLVALVVLRAVVFAGAMIVLFRLLRGEAGVEVAGASVLGLSLLPVISWEAQRAYTHSILAFLLAVVATGAVLRALRRGRWGDHAVLGVVLGLGTLSKLNFALWPAGLLIGAALLPEWRRGLRVGRLLGSAGVAGLLLLPYAVWAARNPELAGASLGTLAMGQVGALEARILGTGELIGAAAAFWGLALLVLGGFALWSRGRSADRRDGGTAGPVVRLLLAGLAVMLAAVWIAALVTGATYLRERWFLPIGWALVPALVIPLWPRLGRGARRAFLGLAAGLWGLGMLAVPHAGLVDPGQRSARFDVFVERLAEEAPPGSPILVEEPDLAGNLAYAAPGLPLRLVGPALPQGAFLLVEERRPEGEANHRPGLEGRVERRFEAAVPRGDEPIEVVVRVVRAAG